MKLQILLNTPKIFSVPTGFPFQDCKSMPNRVSRQVYYGSGKNLWPVGGDYQYTSNVLYAIANLKEQFYTTIIQALPFYPFTVYLYVMAVKVPLQWKDGRLIAVQNTDIADFPGEHWKPFPGFEDYEISNYGRVKSLHRLVETKAGYLFPVAEKIIKLGIVIKDEEWLSVSATMTKNGHRHSLRVARVVYDLFVAPLDYDNMSILVKKSDGDPLNLYFENLRLEDRGEELRTPVFQYDNRGILIEKYASIHAASEKLNIPVSQIKEALREKHLQGKKYYWRSGDPLPVIDVPDKEQKKQARIRSQFRRVEKISLTGEPMEIFESLKAAAASVNGLDTSIITACRNSNRTAYGFKWRYIDPPRNAPLADGTDNASGNNTVTPYNQPVYQYDMQGELQHRYRSPAEAAKAMKVGSGAITNAIKEQSQLVKGYYWRYSERQDLVAVFIDVSAFEQKQANYKKAHKRVVQKLAGNGTTVLDEFESIAIAANLIGVTSAALSHACKHNANCKGHQWRYAPEPQE